MKNKKNIQYITINNDQSCQRIDNFLFTYLKGLPKSIVYKIIRRGEVRINSARIKPKYKINKGDLIRIPPVFLTLKKHKNISTKLYKVSSLTNRIIYEDKYLLILNKPSGMAVYGSNGIYFGIIEALRILYTKINFLELVHRLDRDTSGLLLLAKKRSVLRSLHEQLRLHSIQKEYIALVHGYWPSKINNIKVPLMKYVYNGKKIIKVNSNGKYAETHFNVKKRFFNTTLLKIVPITGRTHQIRIHTQYVKHPIVYDNRYGNDVFDQKLKILGLKRLFLHATSLIFIHPITCKKVVFTIPLDEELRSFLVKLDEYKQ